MFQSSPNVTNLTVKICIETEHLPAWRSAIVNVGSCCLLLPVFVQKQQCSWGLTKAHRIVLYCVPTSAGFRSVIVSAIPTSPDAWQPSCPSASGLKAVHSLSSLPSCSRISLSHWWCGRCLLVHLAREQAKAGPLASAKATVSGVGALFSCKATLSSLTASILTTASYLPHASSCTHQSLKPSLCRLPLAQNTKSHVIPASADAGRVC